MYYYYNMYLIQYYTRYYNRILNCLLCLSVSDRLTLLIYTGVVQYYTYKPIAIGAELLLFYGDEYFVELGYEICREEPSTGC